MVSFRGLIFANEKMDTEFLYSFYVCYCVFLCRKILYNNILVTNFFISHLAQALLLQSSTKYLKQTEEIKQDFDNRFCVILQHYYRSFISGRKTGS